MRIYHWTSLDKARTALRKDMLAARRWKHFLEAEDRYANGTSWSAEPTRWKAEYPVRIEIDRALLPNLVHSIAGNRTYLLTMGMTNPLFDPDAWRHESETPDEEFVEGPIRSLSSAARSLHLDPRLDPETLEEMRGLASERGIPIVDAYALATGISPALR